MRALILTLGLAACSIAPAPDRSPVAGIDYIVETSSDDAAYAFSVSLQSLSNWDVCFLKQDWPFPDGNWIGDGLFRIVSDEPPIAAPHKNYGSCIGPDCFERLAAHAARTAKLNYSVFGEPNAIARLRNKRLEYGLAPHFC